MIPFENELNSDDSQIELIQLKPVFCRPKQKTEDDEPEPIELLKLSDDEDTTEIVGKALCRRVSNSINECERIYADYPAGEVWDIYSIDIAFGR